jgi:hypothetical protein
VLAPLSLLKLQLEICSEALDGASVSTRSCGRGASGDAALNSCDSTRLEHLQLDLKLALSYFSGGGFKNSTPANL